MKLTTTQVAILEKAIEMLNAPNRASVCGADCVVSHAAIALGLGSNHADCAAISNAEKDFRPTGSINTWDYSSRASSLAAALRFNR